MEQQESLAQKTQRLFERVGKPRTVTSYDQWMPNLLDLLEAVLDYIDAKIPEEKD
jgi:hypothetical protein